MVIETINKKYYVLIENNIYNLIQIEDEHLSGSIKAISTKEFEAIKIFKIYSL